LIGAVLKLVAAAAAVPALTFAGQCLAGALPRRKGPIRIVGPTPRTTIVVPAHNESEVIEATLESLRGELSSQVDLLVVADNCEDDTPQRAERAGARVVRRVDSSRRGKGYALEFALQQLERDPPEVVVVVDADCRVLPGSIERIARLSHETQRPVQADYLILSPSLEARTAINALAFLVKNRVRPLGLLRRGLPCQLTGSGMAFPWKVMRAAPPTGDYLVEDMLMGLELAKLGHPPLYCPEARIESELPERATAQVGQRRRWEHGHLATLLAHGGPLLLQGVRERRLDLAALGLDLLVPPLALLVLVEGGTVLLCVGGAVLGAGSLPALMTAGSLAAIAGSVGLVWVTQARDRVPLKFAAQIPGYVLWKLPLYLAFAARKKQATWEQTERKPRSAA